jgi:hypothetical protein
MLFTVLAMPVGVFLGLALLVWWLFFTDSSPISSMGYTPDDYHDDTQNVWSLHHNFDKNEVALSAPELTRHTKHTRRNSLSRHQGGHFTGLAGGITQGEQLCADPSLHPDVNCFRHYQLRGEKDYHKICRKCSSP